MKLNSYCALFFIVLGLNAVSADEDINLELKNYCASQASEYDIPANERDEFILSCVEDELRVQHDETYPQEQPEPN